MTGTIGLTEPQEKLLADLEYKLTATKELTGKQQADYNDLSMKHLEGEISDKESAKLKTLEEKKNTVIGHTDNQAETYADLIDKRDNDRLSEGIKNYLKRVYRATKFRRRKQLVSKYIQKGNKMEEEAITMYSLLKGEFFINNTERVTNEWITGEYDIYSGEDINSITEGYDTKCSWDLSTFPFEDEELDAVYYWQNQCYMDLSGAEKWTTVYCLANLPDAMIDRAIYREQFDWDGDECPEWKKLEIINNHVYDEENFFRLMKVFDCKPTKDSDVRSADIVNNFVEMAPEERIIEKVTLRDQQAIDNMHSRVEMSRKFLVALNQGKL
jgi:hypothetical protein